MMFDHIPTNLLVREGPGYWFRDSVSLQAIGETKGGEMRALPAAKISGRLLRLLAKVALMKMCSVVTVPTRSDW